MAHIIYMNYTQVHIMCIDPINVPHYSINNILRMDTSSGTFIQINPMWQVKQMAFPLPHTSTIKGPILVQ